MIEPENESVIPLFTLIIRTKARILFEELNATDLDPKVQPFASGARWFEHF